MKQRLNLIGKKVLQFLGDHKNKFFLLAMIKSTCAALGIQLLPDQLANLDLALDVVSQIALALGIWLYSPKKEEKQGVDAQ